jgi:NADPH-dependent 2,4-dienoyl-CoA reductase/sulfur reductase-like enzyme
LLGAESHAPYLRPPLSKKLLTGEDGLESTWIKPDAWYSDHEIELRTDTHVTAIHPATRTVTVGGGEAVPYNRLLIATGSRPRTLDLPGFDHHDVHHLRTLDDSLALRDILKSGGQRVVLVGSGWIGLELAAAATQLGNDVTVLDRNAIPLSAVLGDEMGGRFADVHRQHGVGLLNEVSIDEIVVIDNRVTGVRYNQTEVIAADLVVVGVGAVPNVELAQSAGLDVDNGILVDEYLRSSDHDIFAAGDVASAWHPVVHERIRSEHWMNAIRSGQAAAKSMLGLGVAYAEIPYFYTDQFEIGMEYSGYASWARGADVIIRGDLEALEFIAFWVRDDRVVAGMNVNVWDVNEGIQGLIRSRRRVSAAALTSSDPLDQL